MAFITSLTRSTNMLAASRPVIAALARRGYATDGAAGPTALNLTFSTPKQSFFDKVDVSQVDVPLMHGNYGLMANHVPIIGVLKPGKITVQAGDSGPQHYIVSSGTVTVNGDSTCQILCEEAAPLENFDVAAAKAALNAASSAASSGTEEEKAAAQVEVDALSTIIEILDGKF